MKGKSTSSGGILLMAVVLMGSVIVPGDTTFHDMRLKDLNLQNVEFNWEEDIDEVAEGYLSGLDVQIYSDSMVTLHTAN
ncbi:MAG: hypothetical protein ACP5NN_10745 [Methanolinea sp.]|jgi:hypothetical protein